MFLFQGQQNIVLLMNQKSMRIFVTLCIGFLIFEFANSQQISNTLAAGEQGETHTFDVTGFSIGSIINIKFDITHPAFALSSIALFANTQGQIDEDDISRQSFYHQNPFNAKNYDLDAMWDIRDQHYINLVKKTGENTLYLTVFRFDPTYRLNHPVDYDIYIVQNSGYQCAPCANGETSNTQCVCRNCQSGRTGKICSRKIWELKDNVTMIIERGQQYHLELPQSETIVIQMSVSGCLAEGYVQFKKFNHQVATLYNVAEAGSSGASYQMFNSGVRIKATPNGQKVLVTPICYVGGPAEFKLNYYLEQGISVLIIVMAVLGGLILLGLIIAAICLIKRARANAARVRSEMQLPSNNNKLTANEIERFFPPTHLSQLKDRSQESSINQMNDSNNQKEIKDEKDCVICLQNIQDNEQIRMGYCRHMFHSNCLISWFNKQRNCPYCRKDYNREETQKEFQALVQKNGNKNLQGKQLVKAIYNSKSTSKQTIVQDLE